MLNKNKQESIAIIGAGFAGLSAAAHLAKLGYNVTVFEKNDTIGGRARQLKTDEGYVFDMGPSWYWMPDVFEKFFNDFGFKSSDFYELTLLDPSFDVIFGKEDVLAIPENYQKLRNLFESIEAGSSIKLDAFMKEAEFKYKVGMDNLVYKPGLSLLEFADVDFLKGVFKLQVFTSFSKHVKKYFTNPKLIALMEFPVLFLGATPENTPALYSLMNYAGLKLGTWYPTGGFGAVIEGMKKVCEGLGVQFYLGSAVQKLQITNKKVDRLVTDNQNFHFDAVIATADYEHVESKLLPEKFRNYGPKYWDSRVLAPSSLIFYIGVKIKVNRIHHHSLFFDEDLKVHAEEIYTNPQWPKKPLFYVCCPSKTDQTVAPAGHENLFILIPIAPNLEDTEALREKYFHMVMDRLENYCDQDIRSTIDYKKSYCVKDFITDYNAYKGNAYGLANTLMQTANLKPSIKNKKLNNFFYAGQLTVPGPGVPPSVISGNVAAQQVNKYLTASAHERNI
jgi:phytoene desaturase